jgi:hypothetical protein
MPFIGPIQILNFLKRKYCRILSTVQHLGHILLAAEFFDCDWSIGSRIDSRDTAPSIQDKRRQTVRLVTPSANRQPSTA